MLMIAVPCKNSRGLNSEIEEHFGRAKFFALVEVEGDKIKGVDFLEAPAEHSPGELPEMLRKRGVEVVLAYGMGPRAIQFFESYGIRVVTGAKGEVGEVVEKFVKEELEIEKDWMLKGGFKRHEHQI